MFMPNEAQCVVFIGCPVTSGRTVFSFYHRDGSRFSEIDLRAINGDPATAQWDCIGTVRRCDT